VEAEEEEDEWHRGFFIKKVGLLAALFFVHYVQACLYQKHRLFESVCFVNYWPPAA